MDEFVALAEILLSAGAEHHGRREVGEAAAATVALPAGNAPLDQVGDAREVVAARLRDTTAAVGFYGHDPLLTTLAGLRRQRLELDAATRRLLAYGREFVRPRPYRLVDLADAAGMSISGVRTAYDGDDVAQVAAATGLDTRSAADGGVL